jgi:hypothetical protein
MARTVIETLSVPAHRWMSTGRAAGSAFLFLLYIM